jgi:hypothetical protein
MGRATSIIESTNQGTTLGGNRESNPKANGAALASLAPAAESTPDRRSQEETRASAPGALPTLAGILSRPKGSFMRTATYSFGVCLAIVALPLMAVRTANALSIRTFGLPALIDRIQARSNVAVADDFRQDLRRWAGKEGSPDGWTLNGVGYVIPGQLAIDIRSVPMTDYRMEFAGQIERKGLGFVYRAMDFDNYYAARIVLVNDHSIPEAVLERYAVIGGQAGPKTQVRLTFPVRTDTMYDVELEARGGYFITRINHHLVDAFTDSRLPRGGAGFFASTGESARIYRSHVSKNNDLLGKVCSLLAPLS